VDGWKYMPTARPACTGPARAGRCALVLDPVHMGATLACASRVHAISLGSRTRMAFSYYGDLGRVASSFEVAMDSGFFHVYFPDPAAGIGIEVVSNLGRATLPATTGTGRGWHLVTLDVDAVAPTLTLTVEGASATVPIDLGATLVTSMQLIGDPWAERTVPSTTPSAVRIDSMVIETVDPQPVPVVPAAPATKGGGVEAPGCPVAVDGIRPGSAVPHHQVG
jgi:hypothetical protein